MTLSQKINGDQEQIYKFVWPLFAVESDADDCSPIFFAYDYDTIEGIDHIISELDLENKAD